MSRRWHVDAWAVRDGMAFASFRAANDLQGAERTVFIGVPGLDALPVGRVSTALWAARANFQDGLIDPEDRSEIGFDSLDEVRELVRRGYLAGGIGPGPVGGEPPQPRPEGPEGQPSERRLEDRLREIGELGEWSRHAGLLASPIERRRRFALLLDPYPQQLLIQHLRAFAAATVEMWSPEFDLSEDDEARIADYGQWIHLLSAMDLWDSVPEFTRAMLDAEAWGFLNLYSRPRRFEAPFQSDVTEQIVFRVPCPLRPGWDTRIRRLSDKLFLATSTSDYFRQNPGLAEFVPALLAALAVVVQQGGRFAIPFSGGRLRRLTAALDWLSAQMPQRELPPAAENALKNFAWNELSRRELPGPP